jgi:hypothetical protein
LVVSQGLDLLERVVSHELEQRHVNSFQGPADHLLRPRLCRLRDRGIWQPCSAFLHKSDSAERVR